MADFSVKRLDEMDSTFGGTVLRARASLGLESFGMQIINMPPHWDQYPNHDHLSPPDGSAGQEEAYISIAGSASLRVNGEEHPLEPGVVARVGPGEKRQIVPGSEGFQVICLGGIAGRPYSPPAWTEVGAPPPVAP